MREFQLKIYTLIFIIIILTFHPYTSIAKSNYFPSVGDVAPDFALEGYSRNYQNKKIWKLSEFDNSWKVLYFYPKDFTSGCTIEARNFEKLNKEFTVRNAHIIGISNDLKDQHESFCSKENLSFTLLTDQDGDVSSLYGSWTRPYSQRNTFLIDPDGIIKSTWIGVSPSSHPKDVLNKLKQLQS